MPIDAQARLRPNESEITFTVIDGEAILINLTTGAYYSMEGVAVAVWEMVQAQRSVPEIVEALTRSYEVDAVAAQADVLRFLGQLSEESIVAASDAESPAAPASPQPPAERQPWEPPTLNVYSDMADLLALDPPSPGLLDNVMRKADADLEG